MVDSSTNRLVETWVEVQMRSVRKWGGFCDHCLQFGRVDRVKTHWFTSS